MTERLIGRRGGDNDNQLASYEAHVNSNGDTIYTSSENGFIFIASSEGNNLLSKNPKLLDILKAPYKRRIVRRSLKKAARSETVAVKQLFPYDPDSIANDLNGFEMFTAIRGLQEKGVQCATPFFGTTERYVSSWIQGEEAGISDKFYIPYIRELLFIRKALIDEGKWDPLWMIDNLASNYLRVDQDQEDIFQRFVAIDPVVRISSNELISDGLKRLEAQYDKWEKFIL